MSEAPADAPYPPEPLPRAAENPWQTISSRVVYEKRSIRVREDAVIQPDGAPGTYAFVEVDQPAVTIAALDADLRLYLVRQWRYPWQRDSWELPGGLANPGDAPLTAAQRELREETGLRARQWTSLGSFYVSATLALPFHVFLARDLEQVDTDRDPQEQDMIVRAISFPSAVAAALNGGIVHAASISTIFKLSYFLRAE